MINFARNHLKSVLTVSFILIVVIIYKWGITIVPVSFGPFQLGPSAARVIPEEIVVSKSDWEEYKSVQILNDNAFPIYSVQLKVWSSTNDMNNIHVVPSEGGAWFVLSYTDSATEQKSLHVFLNEIKPHEQVDITLIVGASTSTAKLNLKVTHYENESPKILVKPGSQALPFAIFN